MNKTKKLLSVVLAIVMALSCMSMTASAAVTQYKTVAELEALDAYSPYGQVTRLSTEERASIVQDFLDTVLPTLGLNMGELFNLLGLSITIDLSSVDRLCYSLDTVKNTLTNVLASIVMGIVDLGVLEQLNMDTWNTGIDRAGDSQLTLFAELFQLLSNNTTLVNSVLTDGLSLGIVGGLLGGSLDLSSINEMVTNLPALIKGLVFPLIERWDDSLKDIKDYDTAIDNATADIEAIANKRIQKLFTDNMSITTIKYDAQGNMTSEHADWLAKATGSEAPGKPANGSLRYYYQITGTTPGSKMYSYHIVDNAEAEALAKDTDDTNNVAAYEYIKENQVYVMTKEVEDSETCETYVWKAYQLAEDGETIETGSDGKPVYLGTLKYYNDESPLIPALKADVVSSKIDLTNANISAGDLLYTFIPYLFEDLAVVVLNGSVKKILAEFFGAQFTMIGKAGPEGDEDIKALGTDDIFVGKQGDYVFEWSDYYIAADGTHYYRYLDDLYRADLTKTNNYFDIINWNFEIGGDFMNEFIPASDDNAGDRLLLNLNDFLVKVAETITLPSASTVNKADGETAEWTRPTFQKGSNGYAISNIKAAAQAVISLAPEHIFGSNYETNPRCYYDMFMYENADEATENAVILTGIAAQLVDIIMPSMTLPTAEELIADETRVGAILAGVVREFAAYLVPEYNFDDLIYQDFGTTEADPVKTFLKGKDSNYWFDVILTMGINVGFEYLRAFADMGEGTTEWNSFVAYSGYGVDGKTYAAMSTEELNAHWEGMLDYVIDWALDKDYEWSWKMENLVNTTNLTIDMTTAQDPFVKLQQILGSILPVDEILTVEPAEGETKFEHWLRQDLILGIVDLKWDHLVNTIQFNNTATGAGKYFRTGNVLDQLATLLKSIVNPIFNKIGGGNYALIPASITDFNSLATQAGIKDLAVGLVGKLQTAYNAGLLDTALPILNFFIGWKTDPQVRAEPVITETHPSNKDFSYQSGSTISGSTIHFLNNSSGMLEIHRNSDVKDHEYAIRITGVTSDATVNTLTFNYGDGYASPYETVDIAIGGTYRGEEAATITIAYEYVGKDGQGIGGTQYTSRTILFSNQAEDADVQEPASQNGNTTRNAYNKFIFTKDIYATVTSTTGSISQSGRSNKSPTQYEAPAVKTPASTDDKGTCDTSDDVTTPAVYYPYPESDQHAKTYFGFYTNASDAGWGETGNGLFADSGAASGKFFKGLDQYGPDYDYPIGVYAFPLCLVTYDNKQCLYNFTFIHYDDYGLYDIYTANKENGYNPNQGVDPAIYNEYNEAWKMVVYGATYPLMTELNDHADTDYFKAIYPYIPAAIERFEAAKEAYETALADAQASGSAAAALPAYVDELRDEIDNDYIVGDKNEGKEINFQDVEYYEYFNYNDVKVAAENLYRTYLAPEILDTYHIFRSGIREAELDFVIAGEDNATIQEAIKASRRVHDQAAIDASVQALADWKQPVNTKLFVEDLTSRLAFYKQFVVDTDNREGNEHLYFLNQELAHMAALNLDEADYEAVSWDRYEKALGVAQKVAAGNDDYAAFNSRIYDVKYNLMVAYKQLLLKDDSLIEAGGTADLLANIEKAEAILAMNIDDLVLSETGMALGDDGEDVAEEFRKTAKEKALGHLIEGLGYYYQARYSEHDIEVQDGDKNEGDLKYNADGSPMMFNLYDESAYEYADNDRPDNQGNQAKVDACNANLEACIAYFETAEAEPNTIALKEDAPFEAIIDTDNTIGGEYTGTIYGFDTLGWNENWEADGAIADFVTTAYGDDYLEVVVGDAGVETTGTIINVLDEDGNVVESYVYIYYGDIDMDGEVGETDAIVAADYGLLYEGIETLDAFMAGDVDADSVPGETDAIVMADWGLLYEGMPFQADVGVNVYGNIVYEIY